MFTTELTTAATADSPVLRETAPLERLPMFDAARFLAAVAVIWLHTPEAPSMLRFNRIGAFAVPFFVFASIFFLIDSVRRHPQRRFSTYAVSRFKRVYVPFLIWSVVYFGMRSAKYFLFSGSSELVPIRWSTALVGTAHHLWFLPFICVLCIAVFPIGKLLARSPGVDLPISVVAASIGITLGLFPWTQPNLESADVSYFLGRIIVTLPAVFWGIAFAAAYTRIPSEFWLGTFQGVLGLMLAGGCIGALVAGEVTIMREDMAGFGWLLLTLTPWRGRLVQLLARGGSLAFGIFLCHVLFVEGLQSLAKYFHIGHELVLVRTVGQIPTTMPTLAYQALPWLDLSVFPIATILSVAVTSFIAQFRWHRWILPT